MFLEQLVNDTDAAIQRLFQMLSEVHVVEIRVLDPNSGPAIMSGTVTRDEALTISSPSPGMRLKKRGSQLSAEKLALRASRAFVLSNSGNRRESAAWSVCSQGQAHGRSGFFQA